MEVIYHLEGGGGQICEPGLRWDSTWKKRNVNLGVQMELGCWSWDLDGSEMGPGFSWDAQLETWLGWHETRMGNYWGELDGGDTRHGWWWHKILGTWIRVRHDLGGCALHNLRPWCVWDGSWMNLRLNFWDLNGGENLTVWILDADICLFIDVEYNMDGEDTWIWESGLRSFPNL